jgi:phosphoenolpyruvate carboxylase
MSQVKKIARLLFVIWLSSCRLLKSDEQNAINDIDKYEGKLRKIYAQYPQFKRVDTVETVVTIQNPLLKIDTVVLYKDSVIREKIYKKIVEKCKDSALAKQIAYKILDNYKCIKDSIVIKDSLYKAIITQDSLGVHVNIIPNDSTIKAKYKVPCPVRVTPRDKFWSHEEFWFVAGLFAFTILGILIHLRLQK